jgi:hypothetical protein
VVKKELSRLLSDVRYRQGSVNLTPTLLSTGHRLEDKTLADERHFGLDCRLGKNGKKNEKNGKKNGDRP